MKNNRIRSAFLGLLMVFSSVSCNKENPDSPFGGTENVLKSSGNDSELTNRSDDLAVRIRETITQKGCDRIKGQAIDWGMKICRMVLESVGLPVSSRDPSARILDKLEQREKSLKSIETAISQAISKIDQNESTRILDNFREKFNELKTSVSPVRAGLATFADQEKQADGDEEKLSKIKADEEKYYKDYVATLKKGGNSFSERVILLANSIVSPSTNPEYNLLRCFDLSVRDANPKLQWNTQRIRPKNEYITYISSLLLNALSIARFEISYQLQADPSAGGQAMWKKVESDLDEAVSPALTKLQDFFKQTKKEEDAIKSGEAICHVKTGIEVSAKRAILSLNNDTNVLSYKNTYTSYPSAGGIETGYQRRTLKTKENLIQVLRSGYKDYLQADSKTVNDFSFYQYLNEIGFWTNGDDGATIGIWNRTYTEHKGNTFTNEYDYFKTEYIDRSGELTSSCFGTIIDKVWHKACYESNSHLNDKYLVFLAPGADQVFGDYETLDFASVSRGHQTLLKEESFPGTLDYKEAAKNSMIGKVDKSW